MAKLSLPDAGFDGSTCAFSSSTSCLTTFGTIAVDNNGQNLYFVSGESELLPDGGDVHAQRGRQLIAHFPWRPRAGFLQAGHGIGLLAEPYLG